MTTPYSGGFDPSGTPGATPGQKPGGPYPSPGPARPESPGGAPAIYPPPGTVPPPSYPPATQGAVAPAPVQPAPSIPGQPPGAQQRPPGTQQPQQQPPTTAPERPQIPGLDRRGRVRTTRASYLWVGMIIAALVLILLLIFIAQNSQQVSIHFLGFHGHLSFAVAVLIAAVCGLLLVAIPGTMRIVELRKALKKAAATVAQPGAQPPDDRSRGNTSSR
jgi:uncharacterized integral membrane protein